MVFICIERNNAVLALRCNVSSFMICSCPFSALTSPILTASCSECVPALCHWGALQLKQSPAGETQPCWIFGGKPRPQQCQLLTLVPAPSKLPRIPKYAELFSPSAPYSTAIRLFHPTPKETSSYLSVPALLLTPCFLSPSCAPSLLFYLPSFS